MCITSQPFLRIKKVLPSHPPQRCSEIGGTIVKLLFCVHGCFFLVLSVSAPLTIQRPGCS
jgi:hypothetical protein